MEMSEKIAEVRADGEKRENFIKENTPFIVGCTSCALGRFADKSDDAYAEALCAFNGAIDSFNTERGNFFPFAKTCMINSVRDYIRKTARHKNVIPFTSLERTDSEGETEVFEVCDEDTPLSDTSVEIFSLKEELSYFDISFFDLPKSSPKSAKTRKYCRLICSYAAKDGECISYLYSKKSLPVSKLKSELKINKKVFERYRKYIIAGILILNGGYEILSKYFKGGDAE